MLARLVHSGAYGLDLENPGEEAAVLPMVLVLRRSALCDIRPLSSFPFWGARVPVGCEAQSVCGVHAGAGAGNV
jgi:hypothetical protein